MAELTLEQQTALIQLGKQQALQEFERFLKDKLEYSRYLENRRKLSESKRIQSIKTLQLETLLERFQKTFKQS